MKEPLVSILVPVYNVEEYLGKCLDSIIGQTLHNIEIICVNDGSTDNSLEILERYRKKDNRIRIINKANGGLPSARNAGLDVAKGKYVGFVDSDDYIEKNMFQKLYEVAKRDKSEIVVCGAHIFPKNPRANSWLYSSLSPWYQHYDNFEPRILFECVCTTPFLWRMLIKRNLIEKHNLRLNERILIGEDKLFQTKIYPKAKGITIIPDKLYHYCWHRNNSMMNQEVNDLSTLPQKIKSHSMLIESISQELLENNVDDDMKLAFLKWSIPFIYEDFISLPLNKKIDLAEGLISIWENSGYYNLKWKIEDAVKEKFDYVCQVVKETIDDVKVSVVVYVSDGAEYIKQELDSILNQSVQLECILVNNGVSDDVYKVLHQYLFKDKRIRLLNMENKSYSEALNNGIDLAIGQYLTFGEAYGWYKTNHALEEWTVEIEHTNADICASIIAIEESSKFLSSAEVIYDIKNINDRMYMDNDFHHVLYRREFLIEEKIRFEDNSIITGVPFLIMAISKAKRKSYYAKQIYVRRHMHRLDWISTDKCEKVLNALDKLMVYSLEKRDADIQAKVLSVLNDDYYKKIIINNTRAYCMPPESKPNGENSQVEIFIHIYNILSMVEPEWLSDAGYDLNISYLGVLYELIKERHEYLADLSDKYYLY